MNPGSDDPTNGLILDAKRITRKYLKKMLSLGFSEAQTVSLLADCAKANRIATADRRERNPQSASSLERQARAQHAIRALMAAGFSGTDIADLVGVRPSTIAHILRDEYWLVGEEKVVELESAVHSTSWWERVKNVMRCIPMKYLDACAPQGKPIGFSERETIEVGVREELLRSTDSRRSPMPPPIAGLEGVLMRVGNPLHMMFLIKLWLTPATRESAVDECKQLEILEHEIDHLLTRLRKRRIEMQDVLKRPSPSNRGGRFA
jgi:hypothetical protein